MNPKSYHIRAHDEDGVTYINSFEVKPIDGKLSYVAGGSDSRVGATYWDFTMASAVVAFLKAYAPDRDIQILEVV